MMRSSEVELLRVTKRYGTTVAVDAVDLTIPGGTYCCLLGPSGCGKTSTLRMIAGHEVVSEGRISIGAENVTDLPPARRGTAMMFQSYALFPHLTVLDNVAFARSSSSPSSSATTSPSASWVGSRSPRSAR
jgi:putative spermidine/putrescine transport system ATP-binding protein